MRAYLTNVTEYGSASFHTEVDAFSSPSRRRRRRRRLLRQRKERTATIVNHAARSALPLLLCAVGPPCLVVAVLQLFCFHGFNKVGLKFEFGVCVCLCFAELPGFYFDSEKNRYFPIRGPIPGSRAATPGVSPGPPSDSRSLAVRLSS